MQLLDQSFDPQHDYNIKRLKKDRASACKDTRTQPARFHLKRGDVVPP